MSEAVIAPAVAAADVTAVAALFREYVDWLGIDLSFQDFEGELAALPGAYTPPGGGLWLARLDGRAVGCVAVRPLDGDAVDDDGVDGGACEMKRLYVRPAAQGAGLGRRLAQQAVAFARRAGYGVMRLDTHPSLMVGAVALYRSLGFIETPAYYRSPIPATVYYALRLRD